jgi:hypothetical protein
MFDCAKIAGFSVEARRAWNGEAQYFVQDILREIGVNALLFGDGGPTAMVGAIR